MEKNNIIVDKHCMEYSEVIFSLRNTYSLITTDLSAKDSVCIYPGYISVISLSPDEMQQFVSFFYKNTLLQQIGLSESSLLFLAKSRNIGVTIMDKITQKVCDELGIETIKIEHKNTEIATSTMFNTDTQTSRLRIFRVAACL